MSKRPSKFHARLRSRELVERRRASGRQSAVAVFRRACKAAVESLEQRQLLSTTSDGFTASFFGAQYTSVAAFPAPNTNAGDYSTHMDVINMPSGNQGIAPTDAPATFNPNAGTNGQGYEFSGLFTTHVVVQQSGYFTFYPTTDDGAQINLDGALAGAANLGASRGLTQDTDAAASEWLAGSTHTVQFYYNNGGGGWAYELRWSESAGAGGSGTSLIPYSLMTGSGAPGVANLEAPTPIVTPSVATSTGSTTNSISLSWSSHDIDAASYIVERATNSAGPYTPVNAANPVASADGGTNSYLDTGLTRSTTYYYKLVSNSIFGSASVGMSSEPTSAATAGITTTATNSPLAAPAVGVAPGSGGNVLTIGQVANAATYNILRSSTLTGTYSQVGAVPYSGSATTLSYTDAGNNADSFYEIQAVDNAVATTDPGYSTTTNPTALGSGDGFAANYYNYSFNATPASGATANGFQAGTVYVPPTAPTFQTIIPTINTGGGLGAGNRPAPTPSNFNSAQSNGPGADFSIAFEFNVVAPYNEQMTFLPRTDDGMQLTVDGVIIGTAGDQGATTDVDPVVDSSGKPVVWQAGTTHSVQMDYFQDGGGYEYDLYWTSPSIAALNSNSQTVPVPQYDAYASGSLPNLPVGATPATPPAAPPPAQPTLHSAAPAAPTGFTAAANTQSVNLSVSADAAAKYNIYRTTTGPITSTTGLTPITTITGSPNASPGVAAYTYLDTGLTNNTTYYYAVTGVDAAGEGPPATVSATPQAVPPSTPTGVVAAPYILTAGTTTTTGSTTTTTQIPQVTISIPTVPFATSYQIQRAPQSTTTPGTPATFATVPGGTISASSGATTTFTDIDPTLSLGQIYFYQVYAIDSNGRSASASTPVEVNYGTGVEDHYYNNEYWSSTPQTISSAAGIVAPGTGAAMGSTSEAAFLPIINSSGSDGTTGIISTTGSTANAEYPDPQGVIGPDNYSDVFTGKITVPVSGAYTFAANTDDDGFLYVDGTLVSSYPGGHGASSNYVNTPITLDAGSYDFDFFQANGGGGWQAHMLWNVSGSGSGATLGTALSVVPSTAFSPISDVPAVATKVTAGTPTLNSAGNSYSVPITFSDNSTDEIQYLLQRSTDSAFDANGQVATVASTGLVDNGHPSSSGSTTVPGTGSGTITDTSAPANGTYYYRVVAINYDGSSTSSLTAAVTTGAPSSKAGVEVNFYNNEWWRSTTQNTTAIVSGAVGSTVSTATLSSDEQATLPNINAWGTAGNSGTLESAGNGAEFPDPNGIIGPNDFSAVFTGQIKITTAGSYTFAANTDDDGYLYIDDQLVSSYPGGHAASSNYTTAPITLTAGEHDVEMFQSNGGGGWAFNMLYSGPDNGNASLASSGSEDITSAAVVPSSVLTTLSRPVVAPTTFTAAVGATPGQVTLTWSNSNTSAIRYVIERSTDPTFSTNVTAFDAGLNNTLANSASYPATSSYTDTGLTFGTTYYYRIFAQSFDGTSAAANATVMTPNIYPSASSVTAVQDVNGNIQVSFPAETYSGINGYQLLRSINGGAYAPVTGSPFYSASAAQYTYQDNAAGLTSGSTYSYEVITQGTSSSDSSPAVSNALYYATTPASGGTTINHSTGFTGETDLTLTGNGNFTPVVSSNGQLEITSAAGNEATGTYETTPLGINSDFSSSFDFQFTEPTTPAADGFAFVIQGQGVNAVGAGGGGLGYVGVNPSVAVYFNMYDNVTQTGLGVNGNLENALDMSGTLGNAFNSTTGATDVFQVSLNYQASTQTLFEAIRDATTGKGYSTSYNLNSYGLSGSSLLGPGSVDYVGFSAGTGASNSQQVIRDWVLNDVSSIVTAQQPQSVGASEEVSGDIAISFPAPSTAGLSGVTYQLLKSVNGGAFADVGSPIPASSTTSYTYTDTGPFTIGSTYTYEAIVSGTSPSSPATSSPVSYVDSSTLVNSVTSYHNDPLSSGQNLTETQLTPANVSSKTGFGKLFSTTVDGQVYAQPLVEPGVDITTGNYQGTHTVVFVETENDSLYAIDSTTGDVLYQDTFLSPEAALTAGGASVTVSTVTSGDVNTGDINPELGITSTPVIDPSTGYLYLLARTKQIVNGNTTSPHFVETLYKMNISNGATTSTVIGDTTYNTSTQAFTYNTGPYVLDPDGQGAGVVTAMVDVNGTEKSENVDYFNALRENNRSGLALHNGTVYIAFASDGDNGPYHGWVLGFNETSLAANAVLNVDPDGGDDGIWQGGGTLTFDPQGYMYFETGNGTFDTTLNAQGLPEYGDYGDSVVKVALDPTTSQASQNINGWGLKVVDYFSPSNTLALASADEDLGSGGCMILPASVGSAAHPNLLVACGKEGKIYLIDRDDMGHFSPNTDNVVQEIAGGVGGGGSYSTPAFFFDGTTDWIYWGGKNDNGRAYKISDGVITTPATYTTPNTFGLQGATPSVSADGTNNGIVWQIDGGSSQLFAYNASNISQELYASGANSARDSLGTAVKFTVPTVANGEVFVGTTDALVVYGLFVQTTAAPPTPTSLAATPISNTQINLSWSETSVPTDAPAGFYIDESTNGGSTWTQVATAGAGAASAPVTGLQPGTTYDFQIEAFNSVGTSTFSNVTSATTTNLAASVNLPSGFASAASQLQLNGSAVINGADLELTNGNDNETSSAFTMGTLSVNGFNSSFQFQLTNAQADGFTFTLQNNANTSIGLGGGGLGYENIPNSVCIKFDLYNNVGEGSDSTGLFVEGDAPTVPGNGTSSSPYPEEASEDMTSSGVVLSSGDPMLANLNYNGTTLTETVTDLSTNAVFTTSYTVDIPSLLGSSTGYVGFTAGTGGLAATQNIQSWVYTPTAGIPYAPTNFTVTPASGTELDLSWTDSLSTVTAYNVLELENGTYTQVAQAPGTANGYNVTGLNSGASYSFEVVAVNSAGSSPAAGPITGTTPVAPVDVTNFAFSDLTTGSVTLTWANDPSNATGLVVTRQLESDSSQYVTTLAPTATSYTDSTLLPGRVYQYTLAAKNLAGPSTGLVLTIETVPAAPAGVSAAGGPGEIALNWTPNGHAVSSYNIYRGTSARGEGATPIATVAVASFTDTPATGLVPGQTYYYTITAVDTGGQSVASAEVSATATGSLPSGVTASSGAAYTYNSTTNTLSLTSGTLTFTGAGSPSSLTLNVTADGANSNLLFATSTYLNSLTLTDGAGAQLIQSGTDTVTGTGAGATLVNYGTTLTQANTMVLVLNSLNIPAAGATLSSGGTNSAQGKLDLTNNAMILNYTPGTGAGALVAADALTGSGSDSGVWDGTGITSSNAEADNNNNGYTAIGVADNGSLGYNTFAGQNVSSGTQILFMYTYNGDADLNGVMNVTDTISYESGLTTHPGGPAGTGWEYGSLDYGATPQGSLSDLQLLEEGFRGYKANGAINISES